MMNKVLVTYASKYGATREIAEKIGDILHQAGLPADVASVTGVADLTPYSAVVLGAALYVGKWHKPGEEFVKKNEKALAERRVWIFSSGPSGEGDPLELIEGKPLPANIQPIADRINPRDITVFHGNIDTNKINSIERWAVKSVVKKPFGDYRNWTAISAWAAKVADELKAL